MNKISLAAAAIGLLALGACDSGNQEQLGNDVQLEPTVNRGDDLNMLSDDAANVAAEAEQLEQQSADLENQVQDVTDNATGPETPADENIQGM